MKKILILKALLVISITAFTQNQNYSRDCRLISSNYYPFPTSDAIWNYRIVGSFSYPYDWSVIDSLGEPISINGQDYVEVYHNENLVGALRDDTIERKVYFHDFTDEVVYYDFNLGVDDTIFYSSMGPSELDYYKVVEAIDFVQIGSDFRKRWHLRNSILDLTDVWVEGIGSVHRYGLHYPNNPDIVLDGSTPYFGCFTHQGISYFNIDACYGTCPCVDWIVKVEEINNEKKLAKVFPNPTRKMLNIQWTGSVLGINSYVLELYDNASVLIYRTEVSGDYKLDISDLSKGFYHLKLISEEGEAYYKLVKN